MAKKAELLVKASALKLDVNEKNTVAEIQSAIDQATTTTVKKATAKSGKRSEKGVKDAEEKAAKVEAQKHREETETVKETTRPKIQQKPAKSKLERKGKKYRKAAEQIEKSKQYTLAEAMDLAVKTSVTKFDATVELHIRLGVDPKQADQNVRDTVVLPSGSGKNVRVAVFAELDKLSEAKKAGADIAEADEFLAILDKEQIDFDILVATPSFMPKLGKYARLLGPKGLMPNPKSGTVTTDIVKAVTEAKAGKVEYRVDGSGIIHVGIGKVSFGKDKLFANAETLLASVKANKPGSLKGNYISSVYATTSMGPSIHVQA